MKAMETWGPFAPGLDDCERRARLRTLRGIARVLAGPRSAALCDALACCETNAAHLPRAASALNKLASLDVRRIVASYGATLSVPAPCAA